MEIKDKTKVSALECCPPLKACEICDTIDIKYRMPFRQQIDNDTVSVEVSLPRIEDVRAHIEGRCQIVPVGVLRIVTGISDAVPIEVGL